MSAHPCPTCGQPWDVVAEVATANERDRAFAKAHPRIHCPACHKRCSALYDSIDSRSTGEMVRMICKHCDHRFEVERNHVSGGPEEQRAARSLRSHPVPPERGGQ